MQILYDHFQENLLYPPSSLLSQFMFLFFLCFNEREGFFSCQIDLCLGFFDCRADSRYLIHFFSFFIFISFPFHFFKRLVSFRDPVVSTSSRQAVILLLQLQQLSIVKNAVEEEEEEERVPDLGMSLESRCCREISSRWLKTWRCWPRM